MNISGTLNAFKLFYHPTLCLPHAKVSTFDQLPIPLSAAFKPHLATGKPPDIRAVVLDKDNCFAAPHGKTVHPLYQAKFNELKAAYPGFRLLIVSNTAGTGSDPGFKEAELLERETGVQVLRHATKKPGCHGEMMEFFRQRPETGVRDAAQVAVVGDRLFTDVMMANMMGGWGMWIEEGTVPNNGLFTRIEKGLAGFLTRRGYVPAQPRSDFE